ncbi:gamma-glutamylcyclotransferase family protein [Sorangium sp. So ce1000]|uniref:gamma-glutamylcyclotransferase family protein n=1 Tax=Sorangium sp. So ce1000 TaxID=3133325 RepID=UPI003F61EB71
MTAPLFVYGTLMRGERSHALLGRARCLGLARTAPSFELADLGAYPALVRGGSVAVLGELYEPDPETLASLDVYEGCPDLFRRESIDLHGGASCEAYLMPAGQALGRPRIASGDWRTRRR